MNILSDIGAIILGLFTAAIMVAMYVFGISYLPLGGYELHFENWAHLAVLAWVICAFISGYDTEYRNEYYATYLVSWVVALTVTAVCVIVGVRVFQQNPHIDVNAALAIAGAEQLLLSIFIFAWFDLLYIQHHKHTELMSKMTTGTVPSRTAAPAEPRAVPAAAAVESSGANSEPLRGKVELELDVSLQGEGGTRVPLFARG